VTLKRSLDIKFTLTFNLRLFNFHRDVDVMHRMTHSKPLHALLDQYQHLAPEYGHSLSNHLPMLLHAMHGLGADEPRLRQFAEGYVKRYDDVPAPFIGQPLARWQPHLGDFSRHADLQATFAATIRRYGAAATLQKVLPELWPGVAAAAFHGLIRTAHAWQAGHDAELAAGLAYWAARWQPVVAPPAPDSLPFAAWSAALACHVGDARPPGNLISDRITSASHSAAFLALGSRLQLTPQSLAHLAAFAVDQFARSGNFTLLHMVTGCRAARVVLAAAPDSADVALRGLVPAFTAAFLASGVRHTPAPEQAWMQATWPEVIARALASDDDHMAKIVHACVEEASVYGQAIYMHAARRATLR
jgi:Questin oxidase-like